MLQVPREIGRPGRVAPLMSPACGHGGRRLLLYFAVHHAPVTRSGSSACARLVVNRNDDGLWELGGPWSEVKEEPAAPRAAGGGHERKGPPNARSYEMTLVREIFRFQANVCTGPCPAPEQNAGLKPGAFVRRSKSKDQGGASSRAANLTMNPMTTRVKPHGENLFNPNHQRQCPCSSNSRSC